jgi:putative acetyltransferase
MPYSDQTEARIVDSLRSSGALTLSLVASRKGQIRGHAAFSRVRINGVDADWYGLGPVFVRPDQQGKGIGQLLIRYGLNRLGAMKAAGCVVHGGPSYPSYYGRFGFESDPGLVYAHAPPEHLQRLVFQGEAPTGEVTDHPTCDAP